MSIKILVNSDMEDKLVGKFYFDEIIDSGDNLGLIGDHLDGRILQHRLCCGEGVVARVGGELISNDIFNCGR